MIIEFDWLAEDGVKDVISLVYSVVDVIRYIVPILLIIMTSLDISKKVIDPNEKEGQQKILRRVIASLIIFLIPVLLKLVMSMLGLETEEVVVDNTPLKTSAPISSLKINNCPSSLNSYHNQDKITLRVNVPSGYNGGIVWSVNNGLNYVTLVPSSDKTSAEVRFSNIYSNTKAEIKVQAGGKTDTCKIYLDIEKLKSLEFTNCPGIGNVKNPGDSFVLKTNIPSNFKESIEWSSDNSYDVTSKMSINRTESTVNIHSVPTNGYVTLKVKAGGREEECRIYIEEKVEPSPSPSPTMTPSPSPVIIPTSTPTPMRTPTPTPMRTPTPTPTRTPTPTPTRTPTPINKIKPEVVVSPQTLSIPLNDYRSYQVKVVSSVPGTFYNSLQSTCIGFHGQDFSTTEINGVYRQYNQNYGIPIYGRSVCSDVKIIVTFKPNDTSKYEQVYNEINVSVIDTSKLISLNDKNIYYSCSNTVTGYQNFNGIYYAPKGLTSQGTCYGGCVNLVANVDYDCVCDTISNPLGEMIVYQCSGKGNYKDTRSFNCYGKKSDKPPICSNWK